MRWAIFIIFLVVAAGTICAAQPKPNDLIGTWTSQKVKDDPRPYFILRSDSTYYGIEGDMIFGGRWKLNGNKLVLWSYIDHEKKIMTDPPFLTVFVINSLQGNVMHVTRPSPAGFQDVWRRTR